MVVNCYLLCLKPVCFLNQSFGVFFSPLFLQSFPSGTLSEYLLDVHTLSFMSLNHTFLLSISLPGLHYGQFLKNYLISSLIVSLAMSSVL